MIRVHIPGYLREFADGRAGVSLDLAGRVTVADVLAALGKRHPGVCDRVLTERGEVRAHVNLFVGEESIRYTGGLATPVADGAEISIVPAISGG